VQLLTLMLSGALAALAGVVELAGVTYRVYVNFSPGYGYTAIAVALVGRLHPLAVVLAGVLFGALEHGALAVQRQANVSSVVVEVVQGLVVATIAATTAFELASRERASV
jgi:simple sugar transport system permease protein